MSLFGVIASVVKRGEHAVENGAQVFGGALDRAARGAGHVAKNVAHEAGHVAKNVVKQDVKGFKKIGHAVEDGGKVFGGALDRVARGAGHMAENVVEQNVKGLEEVGHAVAKVGRTIGNVVEHMSPSDIGHTALDLIGMVPVVGTVANLVNAGWYAAQGDWTDAAWSAAAAIPIGGEAADAAKLVKDGVKLGEDAVKAGEAAEKISHGAQAAARGARAAGRATEAGAKAFKAMKTIAPWANAMPGMVTAGVDAAHGDWKGAALSAASSIPVGHIGQIASRMISRGEEIGHAAEVGAKVAKVADKAGRVAAAVPAAITAGVAAAHGNWQGAVVSAASVIPMAHGFARSRSARIVEGTPPTSMRMARGVGGGEGGDEPRNPGTGGAGRGGRMPSKPVAGQSGKEPQLRGASGNGPPDRGSAAGAQTEPRAAAGAGARGAKTGRPASAEGSPAGTGAERPPKEPSVWVQHGDAIREYQPNQVKVQDENQVKGPHEVGAPVTTDAGKGTVVSRGDPPKRLEVDDDSTAALRAKAAEIRSELPVIGHRNPEKDDGNVGFARIRIYVPDFPREMKAYSKYNNFDGQTRHEVKYEGFEARPRRAILPRESVGWDGTIGGKGAYARDVDPEFKILNELARQLEDKPNVRGHIDLFSENPICVSCQGAIRRFKELFPGVELNVYTREGPWSP